MESKDAPRMTGSWAAAKKVLQWMPKRCRYDADNPPVFTMGMNVLFAVAGCVTVANLYYSQPVLNKIAETFDVSFEKAASIATLLQSGYAGGLLLICPMGDMVKRRPFVLWLVLVTTLLWLGLCLTNNFTVFSALSFLCGMTTVTPQIALPLIGDMAPAHRRASALSVVVSGLMLGLLVARLLSGLAAQYSDWRTIYWAALGAQFAILGALWAMMPDYPATNENLSYWRILWSIVELVLREPLLVQSCLIGVCVSAVFTSFWTTLTFLLASPPYEYSPLHIGLFSLIGILVICGAPVYGRLVLDRIVPWYSGIIGHAFAIFGVALSTGIGTWSVAGPIVAAATLDMGLQTIQTANRSAIYSIDPKARNRINTAYMVAAFCGQLMGTAVGNRLYAQGGWRWSSGFGVGMLCVSVLFCIAKGPGEKGWFGWSGSWAVQSEHYKKKRSAANALEPEEGVVISLSQNEEISSSGAENEKPTDDEKKVVAVAESSKAKS